MSEEKNDEPLQTFEADEAPESISPLPAGLDEARAEVAAFFNELIADPDVLQEVEYEIRNGVEIPNRPWLRDALLEELDKIRRGQQMDHLRHMGNALLPRQEVRGRIRKLLGWFRGNTQEQSARLQKNVGPYVPIYDPEFVEIVRRTLTHLWHDFHDEITDSKPETADGPDFSNDMQKAVRYFYLLFEGIRGRKVTEDNPDVQREELVASRVQVLACSRALCEVLKKYAPSGARWSSPGMFMMQKMAWPIEMILKGHKELKDSKAREAQEHAEILAGFSRAAGGRMI
jgi:hypothetical protein